MTLPRGFRSAGIAAGIKASGKPDLGVIVSDEPLVWAMTATENLVKAPCVTRNRARHAADHPVRAIVVNAGNANCANGETGLWDNEDFAAIGAGALGLARVQDVLTASTGVIGKPLPMAALRAGLPQAVAALQADDADDFAGAILTTDLVTKQVSRSLSGGASVLGIAKGSGMIHPNMATMLAFVLTDAVVEQRSLRLLWREVVTRTLNQVTVDGDTSPNDMAFVFASQRVGAATGEVATALEEVAAGLAREIARDGEGATTLVSVTVSGARTPEEARRAAKSIAGSSLVKAAIHGRDPNWGRILSAIGMSGAIADLENLSVRLQGVEVYRGASRPFDEPAVAAAMHADEVRIAADLAAGDAAGEAWGCDLTADYVRINAEYRT
jgi:glutamate N-acetyltransferase / amino-acid N-acetyltransferase